MHQDPDCPFDEESPLDAEDAGAPPRAAAPAGGWGDANDNDDHEDDEDEEEEVDPQAKVKAELRQAIAQLKEEQWA